jgi:hypothetical protein
MDSGIAGMVVVVVEWIQSSACFDHKVIDAGMI